MARGSRKGYYVDGEFIVEGSAADLELRREQLEGPPSRTARKNESEDLQKTGEALVGLRDAPFDALPIPDKLRDAILEARRLSGHGALRRQTQLIGKLMRQLEPDELAAVNAALEAERSQSAELTALLHRAEQWRDALIADDEKLRGWLDEHPGTDAQQLRALIRQARKDNVQEPAPGQPPRRGTAYRRIFALVRLQLIAATTAAEPAP